MVAISQADIDAIKRARRIIIVGDCGAGKSTLARHLAPLLELPVVHLDQIFWLPGWQPRSDQEWISIVEREIANDRWIIEGNYSSTIDLRVARADVLIWIDVPSWLSVYRVLKRVATNFGQVRVDSAPGCPERWDWEFIKYVWRFKKEYAPRMAIHLDDPPASKRVVKLSWPGNVRALLAGLSRA